MTTLTDTALTALHLLTELDPVLWSIVGRSLWVSVLATSIACTFGVVLGAWLGVARFTGRDALLTVLNTLLALPSVVVGLVAGSGLGAQLRESLSSFAWDQLVLLLAVYAVLTLVGEDLSDRGRRRLLATA